MRLIITSRLQFISFGKEIPLFQDYLSHEDAKAESFTQRRKGTVTHLISLI